jgi:hypothetical protein
MPELPGHSVSFCETSTSNHLFVRAILIISENLYLIIWER